MQQFNSTQHQEALLDKRER